MKGLFVTGTDTGVGKTVVSALLLSELRRRNINATLIKPIQTGCRDNVPDLDYALSMSGMAVSEADYRNMAPYTFEPACSPHLAAEMAATEIDIAEMVIAARTLAADYEFIIAEGAGGVMVPVTRRETMLDLMQALKLPVLVVARPGLGTINHTLLTIRALRSDDLEIAGTVFIASEAGEPGFIEEDNAVTIRQLSKAPILGTIPYCAPLADPRPGYSGLPIPILAEVEKIVDRLGI